MRFLKLDHDWFTILGIFTGDGWLRSDNSGRVGFCFHSDDNYGLSLVKHKLIEQGVEFSVRKHDKKKLIQLNANSRHFQILFSEWFDLYESTSASKHVPSFVLDKASEDEKRAFLKGYLMADGHQGHVTRFSTISPILADQIRFMCWQIGLPAGKRSTWRTDSRSGHCWAETTVKMPRQDGIGVGDDGRQYQWRKHSGGVMTKIRKIELVSGVKEVYDLQVQGNHNYLTSSFLVHNSAVGSLVCYCLGITDVDPIKHGLLFKRFLSEARGGRSMRLRFKNIDPLPPEEMCCLIYSVGNSWSIGSSITRVGTGWQRSSSLRTSISACNTSIRNWSS